MYKNRVKEPKVGIFGGKFLPLHNGHVNAILRAASRCDILYVVLSWSKDEPFSSDLRLSWLGHTFADYKNIKIIDVEHNSGDYTDFDWKADSDNIKKQIMLSENTSISKVFVGSDDHKGKYTMCYPTAEFVILDKSREEINISATEIRKDIYKNWQYLPKIVRKHFVKKVLITGTESCGKSTLTRLLRMRFDSAYVREVGRDYCEYYNNKLTKEHFDQIAMEHALAVDRASYETNSKVIFIDTDAVITKYYLEQYFGPESKSEIIDSIIKSEKYDLILYLDPSTPWVDDGLRFLGDQKVRERLDRELFNKYYVLSTAYKSPNVFDEETFKFIKEDGDYAKRFDRAVHLVKTLLERGS